MSNKIELIGDDDAFSQDTTLYHVIWTADDPLQHIPPPMISWCDNRLEITLKDGVLRIKAIFQDKSLEY